MSKQNDGGPAFPFSSGPEPRVDEFQDRCEGMSLRDWFAGQAVLTVMAWAHGAGETDFEQIMRVATRGAYDIADAMLKARGEKR